MLAISLALSLTPGGAPAVFDPATEDPALWLRGSYGGSPWEGTDSAGTSGTHDFTEAMTPPDVGAAVNGFTPASFNGTNSTLSNASAQNTFISTTEFTIAGLFKAAAAAADGGASAPYAIPAIITGTGSSAHAFIIGYSASGVRAALYDGTWDSVAVAANTGNWHMFFARFSGGLLELAVDGGAYSSVARGDVVGSEDGSVLIGWQDAVAAFYSGLIMELICFRSAKSDDVRAGLRQYYGARYGVSV